MATIKYGALELSPTPILGIGINSRFFGADIRYQSFKTYSLAGTLLSPTTSGISGIYLRQQDVVTGFAQDYLPLEIDGQVIGYPRVAALTFDNGGMVYVNKYNLSLEIRESGNPFQMSGLYYGLQSVTGLFHNIESVTESLNSTSDFREFEYTHSVEVQYSTGNNIDPLLSAKLIASGFINNKNLFPIAVTGGPNGIRTYEERLAEFDGRYGVTETFKGSTGTLPYEHLYSMSLRLGEDGITNVTQQGIVRGLIEDKYVVAKSGYSDIKPAIYPNCSGFYDRYVSGTLNPTYIVDSCTNNSNLGQVEYSRSFTDESGLSSVRWRYSHDITLEGNTFTAAEKGIIDGAGHISERFAQASGYFNTIVGTIYQRTLEQFSGFGGTGSLFNNIREKGFNRFNGRIDYNYGFSNAIGMGPGSGIKEYELTVDDGLPNANRVYIDVISIGVAAQSLNSTRNGQRTTNVQIQAFRTTQQTGVLEFAKHKLNEFRPMEAWQMEPFLNEVNLDYNPIENTLAANAIYIYGGYREDASIYI